jgi:hypothetical protein
MRVKKTHNIGDTIHLPDSSPDLVIRGRNHFLRADVSRRVSKGKYPEFCRMIGTPEYDKKGVWYRNPNWRNFSGTMFSGVTGWVLQDWNREVVETNGKKEGEYLAVLLSKEPDDGIMVGDFDSEFTNVQFDPEGEASSLAYVPDTDSWLFGGTSGSSGCVFSVTNSDLKRGISPSVVSGTPLSGFTGSTGVMHYVKKTGTIILTNSTDKLARSVDFGVTWHPVTVSTLGMCRCIAEDTEGNLVIGTEGGHLIKSVDDGLTWSAVTEATSFTNTFYRAECNPTSGKFMFSDNNHNHPIVMSDISSDVELDSSVTFAGNVRSIVYAGGNTWYCAIDIDSFSKTTPLLYVSTDDGVSWSPITLGDTGYRVYNTEGYSLYYDNVDRLFHLSGSLLDFMFMNTRDIDYTIMSAIESPINGSAVYVCVR